MTVFFFPFFCEVYEQLLSEQLRWFIYPTNYTVKLVNYAQLLWKFTLRIEFKH